MPGAALTQERVFHHVGQRRRHRQRDLEAFPFRLKTVEELDERNVRFGDGLEKPAFFQKAIILRMPDVRQMGVQNQE